MNRRRRFGVQRDSFLTREEFDLQMNSLRSEIRRALSDIGGGIYLGRNESGDAILRFDGLTDFAQDGFAPASSPDAPTVQGGPGYLAVKWLAIGNADPVTYEVHVSSSGAGFTPDASTLAAESGGTIVFVRSLGDGSPLAYDTEYFVRIIAKDADGSAAPGTAGSDELNPNGSDDILAGAITAEKLEAALTLTTRLIAGADDAARVEMGVAEDGTVGITAYSSDGETLTFSVDGQTGQVYIKGRLDFGTGSRLLSTDQMEIAQQATAAFSTPDDVQVAASGGVSASSGSCTWGSPTLVGSLLIAVVSTRRVAGATTISTPAGWTFARSAVHDSLRQSVFIIENAASSRSGAESITFGTTADSWCIQLFEFTGVGLLDQTGVNDQDLDSSGDTMSSGSTSTTTQAEELWFATLSWTRDTLNRPVPLYNPTNDFSFVGQTAASRLFEVAYYKTVTATGVASMSDDVAFGSGIIEDATGIILTFKAKAPAVETPEAGRARMYTKELSGAARFHVKDDAGNEGAVVLGKANEVWRVEFVTASHNVGSKAAHTGGNETVSLPANSAAVGDIVELVRYNETGALNNWIISVRGYIVTTADQVVINVYNANDAVSDPVAQDFVFRITHRS